MTTGEVTLPLAWGVFKAFIEALSVIPLPTAASVGMTVMITSPVLWTPEGSRQLS